MTVLYALKQDLDMVNQDVQELKRAFNLLDYIAKVVHDSELEQMAQAAQMRRMEDRMEKIEKILIAQAEDIRTLKERMDRVEKTLGLIAKHLGI